jgi:hypothetical protein
LVLFQVFYVFQDLFEVKFADFIVGALEKALILLQLPAEMLRKLDSQIFESFKIVTELYKQVQLERNHFLPHHTVSQVA